MDVIIFVNLMIDRIISIIPNIWEYVFGVGGIVSTLVFWRKNIRLKSAEVVSAEVSACKLSIEVQKEQILSLREDLRTMQANYTDAQAIIRSQYGSISLLELKNAQKKTIIAQAHGCKYLSENTCPVIEKQKKIDDDYRKKLEQKNLE